MYCKYKKRRRRLRLLLGAKVLDPSRRHRLGALEGKTERAVPEKLGEHAKRSRDAKEHRVVVLLRESVVVEEDARVAVDVGPRVLGLAVLGENVGDRLVDRANNLEEGIVGHVLERKLALGGVARIRLAQHSMAVTGDNLAAVERIPRKLLDGLVRHLLALGLKLGLEVHDPSEHLLVGEAVERSREGVHASRERKVRVREGGADEVGGVRARVAALVIAVDDEVQAHELVERLRVEAEHSVEVGGVVEGAIVRGYLAIVVRAAVDEGGHLGETSDEVEGVLIRGFPVL